MLDVKKNRLNYGEIISPPEGFELSKAIGTSYSLDLYALLAIPVALFYAKSMEGDFTLNRYDILDAIRKSNDKVDLFCQRGKIKVPNEYNSLLAFMEDCVEEVHLDLAKSSFHPKLWVLRFENKEEIRYRLIVLSRNLTFDRSWDVSYFSDGSPTKKINPESEKLSNFIKELYTYTKREIDLSIFDELSTINFELPSGFTDFEIFPIKRKSNFDFNNPLSDKHFDKLMVISPFIDCATIKKFKSQSNRLTILSRKEELDKVDTKCLKGLKNSLYCINPLVAVGEEILDTEGVEPLSQNLHAKIFIGDVGGTTEWYMGSANASDPAFTRNTELLIKINTTVKSRRLKAVKRELLFNQQTLFQPYLIEDDREAVEPDNLDQKVRELSYHLTNVIYKGKIEQSEANENYKLKLKVDYSTINSPDFTVRVGLVHRKDELIELEQGQVNELEFDNISITNLSSYLVVRIFTGKIQQDKLVVKMEVAIPQERTDIIFNNMINSRAKFFEYIQFILAPTSLSSVLIQDSVTVPTSGESGVLQDIFGQNTAIYESLMLAASRSPKKLVEIDKIIKKLEEVDSEVIADFLPIWNVFKEFAND